MTAADTTVAAPPAAPPAVGRSGRWLAALLLPVGPICVAVLRYLLPYTTVDEPADVVAGVLADPARQSLVLWLGLAAILTLVPAVMAVGRLTRSRAPRVTAAALLLAVPGYLALGWLIAGDLLLWAGAQAELDPATLTRLREATHPTTTIAEGLFVLGHVVGTVLLGIALWRSQTIPRWAAAMTVVSQPLHLVAAVILVSPTLDLVAWGMTAVGFAAAGVPGDEGCRAEPCGPARGRRGSR